MSKPLIETNVLYVGDHAYSSWSLRGWLLFANFGLSVGTKVVDFMAASVAEQMSQHAPARTVPTWVSPEGEIVWDSLALAEELATRHPNAGHWPESAGLRAMARNLTAEMHSGFVALRSDCPMNLRTAYTGFVASEEVRADVARIETLWTHALERSGGPWLAGTYSAADAFFAPVAARLAGYGLEIGATAQAYVAAHLADPAFRRWRATGLAVGQELPWYTMDLPQGPWPGPTPRAAHAVTEGTPENTACPYSGKPSVHLMEMEGRVFGFCNATCRDKTVVDAEAWPEFMALL